MAKDTTDSTRHFTIFFLNQSRKLVSETVSYSNNIVWSRNGSEVARINYDISTITGDSFLDLKYKVRNRGESEWRPVNLRVDLERVRCHFGGNRWYFRCPLRCNKRIAILYIAGDYFGCRHCANITYESCKEGKKMRGFPWKVLTDAWKADNIYESLKRTHYKGRPTRKYRKCLELWGMQDVVHQAEKQLLKEL